MVKETILNEKIITKQKYTALDGIRTLACIGILMMHVQASGKYNLSGFVFENMIHSFTNFVFLFMTVSGFGMCCGYYEKFINSKIDISDFYLKRYKKILPFFALLCGLDFAISPSLNSLYEIIANLTLCFGLIPNANISVIGVGWFLGTVFVFYLMFPFFCFLLSNKWRAWGSFIVAYIMNYLCTVYFRADRTSMAYSFVYFMLGGIIYLYKDKIAEMRFCNIISLMLIIVAGISYYTIGEYTFVMLLFNASVMMYGISATSANVLNNIVFKLVGALSFEIYLCHMVIYRVVEKLHLIRIFDNEYASFFVCLILVLVGAIVFSFVVKKMIDKVMTGDVISKRRSL